MNETVERLTKGYRVGRITRRDMILLLAALSAAAIAPRGLMAQPRTAPIKTVAINHVTIVVTNLKRSLDFYQGLFGAPIVAYQGTNPVLRIGDGPQSMSLVEGSTPGIVNFGIAVENFDPNRMLKILKDNGLKAELKLRQVAQGGGGGAGTTELYFNDPDNLRIQLLDPRDGGGAGIHGEITRPQMLASAAGAPLKIKAINHLTVDVSDPLRAVDFYQKVFGMPLQTKQGATPVVGVGSAEGPLHPAIGLGKSPRGGTINHVCFGMENFDPGRIMTVLHDRGLQSVETPLPRDPMKASVRWRQAFNNGGGPGAPLGTPEFYFTDADNIIIQLQDTRYCAGSGFLGDVCAF